MEDAELRKIVEGCWLEYARTLEEGGVSPSGTLGGVAELAYKQGFLDGMNKVLDKVREALK